MDYELIGKRIREVRMSKGYSQKQFAEILDSDPEYISKLERAKKRITLEWIIAIADALDVTTDSLLGRETDKTSDMELRKLLTDCTLYERYVILQNGIHLKSLLKDKDNLMF